MAGASSILASASSIEEMMISSAKWLTTHMTRQAIAALVSHLHVLDCDCFFGQ